MKNIYKRQFYGCSSVNEANGKVVISHDIGIYDFVYEYQTLYFADASDAEKYYDDNFDKYNVFRWGIQCKVKKDNKWVGLDRIYMWKNGSFVRVK